MKLINRLKRFIYELDTMFWFAMAMIFVIFSTVVTNRWASYEVIKRIFP